MSFYSQNWLDTTWGELVELKYGKALQNYKDSDGEFPVYGTNGPVGFCNKPLCGFPSVIVGRKGAYRGVHYSDKPFFVIDTAFYIQPKININLKWAYYALLLADINGMDSGSAIPSTSREDFYAIPAKVPPRPIQDWIVVQLDALQDKIELNRQINTTLEYMAQALFKSWFVDFDPVIDNALKTGNTIPDELNARAQRRAALGDQRQALPAKIQRLFPSSFVRNEEMGWVPEGWEHSTLGKICSLYGGQIQTGPFGSQLHASDYVDVGTPVVMPKDLQNRRIDELTTAKIDDENASRLSRHRMNIGDIVFSRRGDVEKHALIGAYEENWLCGTGCLLVRLGSKWSSPSYISFSLDQATTKAWITQHAIGATMPNLNTGILSSVPVMLPTADILNAFEALIGTTEEKISANNSVARSLSEIRDALLPKLLSGQIQIPDAEQQLAKVI